MKEYLPDVGGIYEQDGTTLRVAAIQGGKALLEQWRDETLVQYIVTSRFFLEDGELHWRGNGTYFPCMYPPPTCDTPYDALCKALDYMRSPDGMEEKTSEASKISFSIPNGNRIVADLNGNAKGSDDNWSSIDVYVEFPDGQHEMLCCADYETKEGNPRGHDRLRVMVYQLDNEDPHTTLLPFKHRSIWLSFDEGTYDINAWDEDFDVRDEPMETGHIATLEQATQLMDDLIKSNPQYIWTRHPLQKK